MSEALDDSIADKKVVLDSALQPAALTMLSIGAMCTDFGDNPTLAKEQFSRFNGMHFESALEPSFLALLQSVCRSGNFVSDQAEPGHREVESPQRAGIAINVALNRPAFLSWLEDVTGCGRLREVAGRVVQTLPRPGDELHWHDDLAEPDRRLAITINLSGAAFAGGEFELRTKAGNLLLWHQHTQPGSMLIFGVERTLEHRVAPLLSGGPRRVYTGWAYRAEPL